MKKIGFSKRMLCWIGGHIPRWKLAKTLEALGLTIVCNRCQKPINSSDEAHYRKL